MKTIAKESYNDYINIRKNRLLNKNCYQRYFIMMSQLIKKTLTITNKDAPNNENSRYMKENLTELKREIGNSTKIETSICIFNNG